MANAHPWKAIRQSGGRTLVVGLICAALAICALVVGSEYVKPGSTSVNPRLLDWLCAVGVVGFGVAAVERLSTVLGRAVAATAGMTAGAAVRVMSSAVGYVVVAFAALAVLEVSIEKLIVGAGLVGIVLGIAAQPSLGNVFCGLVLLLSKPFVVGDEIRVRSGALGGIFDAKVRDVSLTYVTLETADGLLKVPNSAMLAAGVGQVPHDRGDAAPEGPEPPT